MLDDQILTVRPYTYNPTPLYGLHPRGAGTPEVESTYSYLFALAGEHRVSPRNLLTRLASTQAWTDLGHSLGRYWDSRHGSNLVGCCNVAKRWSGLLTAATGIGSLAQTNLFGLSRFVCGIGLVSQRQRFCLRCLQEDFESGALPYERLWWRISAAKCCPKHNCYLVEPKCSSQRPEGVYAIPKRLGVCQTCGSIAHKCHVQVPQPTPTASEIWVAEQTRQLVAALPRIEAADPWFMKDQLAHYCAAGAGKSALADRAGMAKSQISYWIRHPNAKTSLPQLLDIALAEQFDLVQLMLGDLTRKAVPGDRQPRRTKRKSRRVNHEALHVQLEEAISQGGNVAAIAKEAGVDISTVAKHEDLYNELRDKTQDALDAADRARRMEAVQEAATTLKRLIEYGRTPSLRAAQELTGSKWYPSQLRSISLAMLRWMLDDKRIGIPQRMTCASHEYCAMLYSSARKLGEHFNIPLRSVQNLREIRLRVQDKRWNQPIAGCS